MELIVPLETQPRRLAILPATFNPPTRAHVALAEVSLKVTDAVVLVLPRVLPHKEYAGVSFDNRLEMLRRLVEPRPRFGVAVSDGGLFAEIAQEAREHYAAAELFVVCGRDAAERIVSWDYGDPGALGRMLNEFHLLVAPRGGPYEPPADLQHAIHTLDLSDYDDCSSTAVRDCIAAAAPWTHLVPGELVEMITRLYA